MKYFIFFISSFFIIVIINKIVFADGGFSSVNNNKAVYEENVIYKPESSRPSKKHTVVLKPDLGYLSDIIALEIAIIAFLIPLIIDVISRLSDRYDSEIIVKLFVKEKTFSLFPFFLVFNIISIILFKSLNLGIYKPILIFIIFLAVLTNIWILWLFRLLKKYLIDLSYVKEKLYNDAEKSLK